MNEEPPPQSSLDLTLTQHPHDEDLEPREVHPHLKIEPLQTWYYCIFSNSRTLVILLQVDPTFDDKLKTIYEGITKFKTSSSLHGFQFSTLNIIVGYTIRFIDYLLILRWIT
jgi:hypothetical protein